MEESDGNSLASTESKTLSRRQEFMLKREARLKEEEAQLTFRPHIQTRRGRDEAARNSVEEGTSRFEKLYSEARKRQEDSNKNEKVIIQNCTFQPKITPRARSKERSGSIEERLYSSRGAGKRDPKLDQSVNSSGASFTPKITKRAKSLERTEATPDRLYSRAQIIQEKHNQLKEQLAKRELEECSFSPKTNNNGRSGSAQKERSGSATKDRSQSPARKIDVGERMQRYLEERQRRLEEAKQAKVEAESANITFKPQLIAKKVTAKKDNDNSDVFTRLASLADKEPKITADYDTECTFQPNITTRRSPVRFLFIN